MGMDIEILRSISKERLVSRWGSVKNQTILEQTSDWLSNLLNLNIF